MRLGWRGGFRWHNQARDWNNLFRKLLGADEWITAESELMGICVSIRIGDSREMEASLALRE